MKITWREDEVSGFSEQLPERVARHGPLTTLRWASRKEADATLYAHHTNKAIDSFLCSTSSEVDDAALRDIENMARLRYAEFFEEDKCG